MIYYFLTLPPTPNFRMACYVITFRAALAEEWRQAGGRVEVEHFEFEHADAAEIARADVDPWHLAWLERERQKLAVAS